ncbi:MAG: Ig domain-containing protein, partial [Thermoguttaceae bacterium]
MSQADGSSSEFIFTPRPLAGAGDSAGPRRKKRRSPSAILLPILLLGALAIVALVAVSLRKTPAPTPLSLTLPPIADQQVTELEQFVLDVSAPLPPGQSQNPVFWLAQGPDGAAIDPHGRFTWQPAESQGPGDYTVVIEAAFDAREPARAETRFTISVVEAPLPPTVDQVPDQRVEPGEALTVNLAARDPDVPSAPLRYRLAPGAPAGATIDPASGRFDWTPTQSDAGKTCRIVVEVMESVERGQVSQVAWRVTVAPLPQPEMPPEPAVTENKPAPAAAAEVATPAVDTDERLILELFDKRKLFHPAEYLTLRRIFADRFAAAHTDQIRAAWGDDAVSLAAWLDQHVDVKEELYTALDAQFDNLPAALALFHEMWKLSPDRLGQYGNLAIAVAVTWDQEKGIYDYAGHQRRTRSNMPADLLGAIDNYKYFVQAEKVMQGRGRILPWEFLVHAVNHRTPLAERQWALQGFLPQRVMIGKCYGNVPYDDEMLASGGEIVKLASKDYTLPNLLAFGGVCAMQADFASRVAKSVGVPAAYVGGESRYGDHHAWVMWVELKIATDSSITFTLESHGRYRGDRYYMGNLTDPKTGQKITDRQLELRLHTVGVNPLAKRQSDLIMAAYPMLRDQLDMPIGDQLAFLDQL